MVTFHNLINILNGINLDIPAGQIMVIMGGSGVGKSTLLRSIALLMGGSDALPDLLGDPESWVRNGADSCRISAVLTTAKKKWSSNTLTSSGA